MSALVQAAAIGPIATALGEKRALLFGMSVGLASFALYGVAWSQWGGVRGDRVRRLLGVLSAAAQTILSKTVAATEQGRLQGALASVRAACQVLTPAVGVAAENA